MPKDPAAAVAGIVAAVGDGSLAAARLQEAATRVYALRLGAGPVARRPGLDVVGSDEHAGDRRRGPRQG